METIARRRLRQAAFLLRKAGPYLLLELLLPGGTLFALLLFAYRRLDAGALASARPSVGALLVEMTTALRGRWSRQALGAPEERRCEINTRDGLEPIAMAPGC